MPNQLNTVVQVESGVITVCDSTQRVIDLTQWLEQIQSGKSVFFGTSGDGTFDIVMREANDSLLSLPEEGRVISKLSAPLRLAINSGNLIVTDAVAVPDVNNLISLEVDPAIYDCMVYLCDSEVKEFFGFVIVLRRSALTTAENPQVQEIEQLG